jgi:hypothetical protein
VRPDLRQLAEALASQRTTDSATTAQLTADMILGLPAARDHAPLAIACIAWHISPAATEVLLRVASMPADTSAEDLRDALGLRHERSRVRR